MQISNPFIVTGYISPKYFCDREVETNTLINTAENSLNTALFSIRRLGKTGLIHHLFNSLKNQEIKCVYVDIMMTNSINDFTFELGKAFFNQSAGATQKVLKKAMQLFRSFTPSLSFDSKTGGLSLDLKFNRSDEIYQDLSNIFDYIRTSKDKYIIAIDEFQQILNYPEKNFEAFLRSKIQFLNNTSFIFSGSKKHLLLSIFGSYSKPLWQSCSFMELKPIVQSIYSEFIRYKFAETNRNISDDALDLIFSITKGITFFVQLICNNLYNTTRKAIDLMDVEYAMDLIIRERESYYINYVNLLTQRQLEILKAIAKENGVEQPTSKSFLDEHRLSTASTVKSAMDSLLDKEVIYKENNKYYVSDIFLSEWLRRIR